MKKNNPNKANTLCTGVCIQTFASRNSTCECSSSIARKSASEWHFDTATQRQSDSETTAETRTKLRHELRVNANTHVRPDSLENQCERFSENERRAVKDEVKRSWFL